MNDVELGALDRSTLRLWRLSNLVGWGILGAVAAIATAILTLRIWAGVLPWRSLAGTIAMAVVAVGGGALADGVIVGDHVYRWPGWVAAAGLLVPAALALLIGAVVAGPVEILITVAPPAVGAGLAALVARWRFRRRPRALCAPAAR
jgi:hypothetical protein